MHRPHPRRVTALAVAALVLGVLPAAAATTGTPDREHRTDARADEADADKARADKTHADRERLDAAPPVRLPADPVGLRAPVPMGSVIDSPAGYQGQQACLLKATPGIVKLRALVLATYARGGFSSAGPRACSVGSVSEHKEGRAWDWMVDVSNRADRNAAADFLGWLTGPGPSGMRGEMAFRLGVMYVIYNQKSWSSYTREWKAYTGYDPHTSHVHVSLSWNGARAHTSFWTGRVWPVDQGSCAYFDGQPGALPRNARTRPCPEPVAAPRTSTRSLAWFGSESKAVGRAQQLLGIESTSSFDQATRRTVLQYQRDNDLPRTGALDDPTWASLQPATARSSAPSWTAAAAARWARDVAESPVLHRRSAGLSVLALQTALRLPLAARNGYFGSLTAERVRLFKESRDLDGTARVGPDVWAALPVPAPEPPGGLRGWLWSPGDLD